MNNLLMLLAIFSLIIAASASCSDSQVEVGCATCTGSNCDSCISTAFQFSSTCSLCKSPIPYCVACSYNWLVYKVECSACSTGYYLSSDSCANCSTSLTHCSTCTSATTCTECTSGYALSSGACVQISNNNASNPSNSNASKVVFTFFALIGTIFLV